MDRKALSYRTEGEIHLFSLRQWVLVHIRTPAHVVYTRTLYSQRKSGFTYLGETQPRESTSTKDSSGTFRDVVYSLVRSEM